jgi:DNA-binding response OmpR family regulator
MIIDARAIAAEPEVSVLLIDDDVELCELMREFFVAREMAVEVVHDGRLGLARALAGNHDLILLDVMLPGLDGLEVLRQVRRRSPVPIIMLTARTARDDRVAGLDAGADDYMVKPFAMSELSARVRALLRRHHDHPTPQTLQLLDLELRVASRVVTRAGKRLDLTPREFALLEYLLLNAGRVVSREMLAKDVWQETSRHTPLDNVIDVQVTRLRKKIDDPFPVKLLHTVRGVGFVMRADPP